MQLFALWIEFRDGKDVYCQKTAVLTRRNFYCHQEKSSSLVNRFTRYRLSRNVKSFYSSYKFHLFSFFYSSNIFIIRWSTTKNAIENFLVSSYIEIFTRIFTDLLHGQYFTVSDRCRPNRCFSYRGSSCRKKQVTTLSHNFNRSIPCAFS